MYSIYIIYSISMYLSMYVSIYLQYIYINAQAHTHTYICIICKLAVCRKVFLNEFICL